MGHSKLTEEGNSERHVNVFGKEPCVCNGGQTRPYGKYPRVGPEFSSLKHEIAKMYGIVERTTIVSLSDTRQCPCAGCVTLSRVVEVEY